MIITFEKSNLKGTISAPPSKSYAHRYLIASSLSNNESTISNVAFSDDITATLNCIHVFGSLHNRDFNNNEVTFLATQVRNNDPTFDCKESGTTLRIFMPIALTKYDKATFIGSERLIARGIKVYEDIFKYILFDIEKYQIKTKGLLGPSIYSLPGNISSQYISGLLYALPLLNGNSEIIINTKLESKNYILMTLDVLKKYNIQIDYKIFEDNDAIKDNTYAIFKIKGNQKYEAHDFSIEGDFSNAAFIDAFNYLGSDISIDNLNANSLQSDKIYKKYFDMLNEDYTEIEIANCIDLGPVLITFAALKNGAKFTNTSRLSIKESNRGQVIAEELKKCCAHIEVSDNQIIVEKSDLIKPTTNLSAHNDHRIAMALSLLSTQFDISIEGSGSWSRSPTPLPTAWAWMPARSAATQATTSATARSSASGATWS